MKTPFWSWANLLSLDAVVVGLLWQWVFALEFCGRLPSHAESGIVGLTIWLAYTADRLLDSLQLDLTLPHTARHRLHLEYRKTLVAFWVVALAIDVGLVVLFATDRQLRWGYVGIGVVLAYVAGVHFSRESRWWFPKELQAGMVFAFGVSLLAWSEAASDDVAALLLSTLMAGFLFAANCFAVADWENDLDASQGFVSWVTRYPASPRWFPLALVSHLVIAMLLLAVGVVGPVFAGCLVASDALLLAVVLTHQNLGLFDRTSSTLSARPSSYCLMADITLVVAPATWVIVGMLVR